MASVGLVTKNAESTLFSSDCIIDIINNYPQLNVTGMAVGTIDDIQLSVAVFFSKSGYPFITHSDIEGDESAEDELVMGDFKDLFKSYTKTKKETDPHSDIKVTYSVKHKYSFMKEWENV